MSKKLEIFIKDNRKSFDTEQPSPELWSKINAGLDRKQPVNPNRWKVWIGIAASLTLVLGLFFYADQGNSDVLSAADVNPEYARKQMRFASLIEQKTDSLEALARKNPELYDRFSADLQEIKSDYKQLKNELPQSANQKLVVKAMERNLELQLQVVSQQLTIINQVNRYKTNNQL
jgi:anion-transporting  ArsA/GET3 family ATPase